MRTNLNRAAILCILVLLMVTSSCASKLAQNIYTEPIVTPTHAPTIDKTPPTLSLALSEIIMYGTDFDIDTILDYVSAVDDIDGDITDKIQVAYGNKEGISAKEYGRYYAIFYADDVSGNRGSVDGYISIVPPIFEAIQGIWISEDGKTAFQIYANRIAFYYDSTECTLEIDDESSALCYRLGDIITHRIFIESEQVLRCDYYSFELDDTGKFSQGEYYSSEFFYPGEQSQFDALKEEYAAKQAELNKLLAPTPVPTQNVETTMGQKNALEKAKQYLSVMAFSYDGLIEQLEFEGYTTSEAIYGADHCGADWYEQAAKKAQEYLNIMSFSRQELIDQLKYEGFTTAQAEYGVKAVGY